MKPKMGGAERVRLKREANLPDTLRELAASKRLLSQAQREIAELEAERDASLRAGSLRFTPTIIKPSLRYF